MQVLREDRGQAVEDQSAHDDAMRVRLGGTDAALRGVKNGDAIEIGVPGEFVAWRSEAPLPRSRS